MRRLLAHVAVVLFAVRALVPAGYMPDFVALGAGQIEMVLCTVHGDVPFPSDRTGVPSAPQGSAGADCPFGMAFAKSFVAPSSPALPVAVAAVDFVLPAASAAGLRPPPQGPPLGPRGPPAFQA